MIVTKGRYYMLFLALGISSASTKGPSYVKAATEEHYYPSGSLEKDFLEVPSLSSSEELPARNLEDLTIDKHDTSINAPYFHLLSQITTSTSSNSPLDSSDTIYNLGQEVVMNENGNIVAFSAMEYSTQNDNFRYRIQTMMEDENQEWIQFGNPIYEDESRATQFERDTMVSLSLSNDGHMLAIGNVKSVRHGFPPPPMSHVVIFKYDVYTQDWILFNTVYSNNAGGGGYHPGVQVSLSGDGSRVAIGIRYFDADGYDHDDNRGQFQILDTDTSEALFKVEGSSSGDEYGSSVMMASNGMCAIYGATGVKMESIMVGSAFVVCENNGIWTTRQELPGSQMESNYGFSVAINSDASVAAVGASYYDSNSMMKDNGVVEVYKISDDGTSSRLGEVIHGERGEGVLDGTYYVGDSFGFSIVLSDFRTDSVDDGLFVRIAIGAPKNDRDGANTRGYYHGHVEVYEIDYNTATSNVPWIQLAYDIDGVDPNEDSGYSISMSSSGDRLVIGSPGFDVISNGFSRGTLRIFEQKQYTSRPSLRPSSEPSITSTPSVSPSVSIAPSTQPSVSTRPSVVPTLSIFPSLSPTQTSQPSETPTLVKQREFKLMSRFEKFDLSREWCLTAFKREYGSKVFIRPCKIYESKVENLQLWRFDSSNKLMLAGDLGEEDSGKFCLKSNSKSLSLQSCIEEGESYFWLFENNAIIQMKKSKKYKIGFDPESRFERLHLFRDGSLNPTIQKWTLVASADFASTIPSVVPSLNPSASIVPSLNPSASKMPTLQPSSSEISCPTGPFNITLMNMSKNTNYDQVFLAAKARWERIIKCDLYDFPAGIVSDWFLNYFETTYNGTVDDLVIGYEFKPNDGPGGVLGFAGPTFYRTATNSPIGGIMSFDSDDFEVMSGADAEIIITHELGHVLGLVGTVGKICVQSCVLNFFSTFECPLANSEYNALNLNKGPLYVDPGSCGHWSEYSFAVDGTSELMTPYFEENLAQPISRVSIAALDDSFNDYVVDYEAADPFPMDRRMLRKSTFKVLVPTSNFTLSEDRMLHLSHPIPMSITPDEM